MSVRVVIADDEPPARERVRTLLGAFPRLAVVAECEDGVAAVEAVRRTRPQLLVLDIQMPGLDGFGVLAALRPRERPVTVFVTAHDEHALRAFEVGVADYVMKPIRRDRFVAAVERALDQVATLGRHGARDLEPLFRQLRADGRWLDRFVVERGGRLRVVPVGAARWLEAADNYVRLHTSDGTHLVRGSLAELAAQLDPSAFVRVHRSAIVAVRRVRDAATGRHGELDVTLDDGTRLRVARSRAEELRRRLRG